MRRFIGALSVVLCLPLNITPALAQVTTVSQPVAIAAALCTPLDSDAPLVVPSEAVCGCLIPTASGPAECARPDEELSRLLDHDTTDHLASYLRRLTDLVGTRIPTAHRAYLRFVWPGVDTDGNLVARDVLYHYPDKSPRPDVLPGVRTSSSSALTERPVYDVLVTFDRLGTSRDEDLPALETQYALKNVNAPVPETTPFGRINIFATAAAAEGLSFFRAKGGKPLDVGPKGSPSMPRAVLKVYAPAIPHRRADISVHDLIYTPVTEDRLTDASQDLADDLTASRGRTSPCAASLATAYAQVFADMSKDVRITSIFSAQASVFRDRLNNALDDARDSLLQDPTQCPEGAASGAGNAIGKVDDTFRRLVEGLGTNVASGETELHNRPPDHISFGFLTAARFGTPHYEVVRARTADDGTLTQDPLPRLISAVIVNWHPLGFHDELISFGSRGNLKVFTGATISPEFGVVGGLGYSPIRGLAANVGYAVMWCNAPRPGVPLHEPLPPEVSSDPFQSARAGSWFWGLSYSFQ